MWLVERVFGPQKRPIRKAPSLKTQHWPSPPLKSSDRPTRHTDSRMSERSPTSPRVQTRRLSTDEMRETKLLSPYSWSAQSSDSPDCAITSHNKSLWANKVTENVESIFALHSEHQLAEQQKPQNQNYCPNSTGNENRTHIKTHTKKPSQRQSNTEAACMEVFISPPPPQPWDTSHALLPKRVPYAAGFPFRSGDPDLQSRKRPHCYLTPVQ